MTSPTQNRLRTIDATRIALRAMLLVAVLITLAGKAEATITVGPWTFEDDAFADSVTQMEPGEIQLYCDAVNLEDALVGFSPVKQIVNIGGMNGNVYFANDFQLEFTDGVPVNGPGDDIVFFDSRFSADDYEIAILPRGGPLTPFMSYPSSSFVDASLEGCLGSDVFGVAIELDDYGLIAGTQVDAIEFRALPNMGLTQGDPVMAGALNSISNLPVCAATPAAGCRLAAKSALTVNDKTEMGPDPDKKDLLTWKWLNGAATTFAELGNPLDNTSYALCIYDETAGTPSLVMTAAAPPRGNCSGPPCWKQRGSTGNEKGFKYRDTKRRDPDGITNIVLKNADAGLAKVIVKAKGGNIPLPGAAGSTYFNQDGQVTVQLINSDTAVCWEAHYPAAAKANEPEQFKDSCGSGGQPACS